MATEEPPRASPPNDPDGRSAMGCNIFLLAILALVVAVLVVWAFLRNPPATPSPAATAIPERVPS